MPCNSDYLDPTTRERELQRAAKLLVFVLECLHEKPSAAIVEASKDQYCKVDYVAALCGWIRTLTKEQRDAIVYDGRNKTSRDLADWWEEHQEADCAHALAATKREAVWFNGCDRTAIEALRYLADNERPRGGEDRFNAIHLLQIADELERSIAQLGKMEPPPGFELDVRESDGCHWLWITAPSGLHQAFSVKSTVGAPPNADNPSIGARVLNELREALGQA